MHRNDSTSRPRLCSETVVFRSSTACKYLRCSKERRFFGLFQPNQLRLRNISFVFVFWVNWFGVAIFKYCRNWDFGGCTNCCCCFCCCFGCDLLMMLNTIQHNTPVNWCDSTFTNFQTLSPPSSCHYFTLFCLRPEV